MEIPENKNQKEREVLKTTNAVAGDEEYEATGPSIKKTQHAAAQQALENSKYPLPQPKPKVKNTSAGTGESKPIMPTVQLNALAMKLNLPPVYTSLSPVPTMPAGAPSFAAIQPPNSGSRVNGVGPTLTSKKQKRTRLTRARKAFNIKFVPFESVWSNEKKTVELAAFRVPCNGINGIIRSRVGKLLTDSYYVDLFFYNRCSDLRTSYAWPLPQFS